MRRWLGTRCTRCIATPAAGWRAPRGWRQSATALPACCSYRCALPFRMRWQCFGGRKRAPVQNDIWLRSVLRGHAVLRSPRIGRQGRRLLEVAPAAKRHGTARPLLTRRNAEVSGLDTRPWKKLKAARTPVGAPLHPDCLPPALRPTLERAVVHGRCRLSAFKPACVAATGCKRSRGCMQLICSAISIRQVACQRTTAERGRRKAGAQQSTSTNGKDSSGSWHVMALIEVLVRSVLNEWAH